ncbi:zinc ribbon domain-containing protein [Thermoflexus sp.]
MRKGILKRYSLAKRFCDFLNFIPRSHCPQCPSDNIE